MNNETKSLSGAVGKLLSVYASKTTAEALALAVSQPNALCFPTDGDEIIFGGKKFGGNGVLSDYQTTEEADAKYVQKVAGKGLSTNDYTTAEKNKLADIEAGAQKNAVTSVAGRTGAVVLTKSDVGLNNVDNTSDANKPISTATQNALNLKAAKSDVYTKSEVDSKVSTVYKVKGTKATIAEVIALTDAKVGDVWNITAEFTLSGKKYPAGTNAVCVTGTSASSHTEACWDALGGTVDLTPYAKINDLPNQVFTDVAFDQSSNHVDFSFKTSSPKGYDVTDVDVRIPAATVDNAGVMNAKDKFKLTAIPQFIPYTLKVKIPADRQGLIVALPTKDIILGGAGDDLEAVIPVATTSVDGLISHADKIKLNSLVVSVILGDISLLRSSSTSQQILTALGNETFDTLTAKISQKLPIFFHGSGGSSQYIRPIIVAKSTNMVISLTFNESANLIKTLLITCEPDGALSCTATSIRIVDTSYIVNDLTTGGVAKVLSAQQGLILKGMIDSLATQINELKAALTIQ